MSVMACIDLHAKACKRRAMMSMHDDDLLPEIERFLRETGMSAYRFGYRAAANGRLVERLRANGRVWPETRARIEDFICRERAQRAGADQRGAA